MSFMYCSEGRRWILNPEKAAVGTIQCFESGYLDGCIVNAHVSLQTGLSVGGMGEITLPGENNDGFLLFLFCVMKGRFVSI